MMLIGCYSMHMNLSSLRYQGRLCTLTVPGGEVVCDLVDFLTTRSGAGGGPLSSEGIPPCRRAGRLRVQEVVLAQPGLVEDVELLLEHGPEDVVGGALGHQVLDDNAVRLPDAVCPLLLKIDMLTHMVTSYKMVTNVH